MSDPQTRRMFLKRTSTGIAVASALGSLGSAARGANEKLVVGLIGCGARGVQMIRVFKNTPNVDVAYVCDVDEGLRSPIARELGAKAVGDFRKMLDYKALDAVLVATPDHWHAPATILACAAGKHVYVEKPLSHNLREGRLLIDAADRAGVKVQHGTQGRSTRMMMQAMEQLRGGLIGDVLVAKCWNVQRRTSIGRGTDTDPPAGFDYDTWVGPATMIPYRTNRVNHVWRWWYHFGTGDMGNDGVHDLDYARWGLGVETHPTRILAAGGKFFFDDDQQFPDTQQVTFEYPGDGKLGSQRILIFEQRLWSRNYPSNVDSGAEYYGTKGQLLLSRRGKIQLRGDDNKPAELKIKAQPFDEVAHVANFCDAIRSGAKLNADPLTGHLSTSLCHLGNVATRLGRALTFDPQREQVVADREANDLLRRVYRDHWGRPKDV